MTRDLLGRVRWVHFVGIGGSGMSALAELLLARGFKVTGSDVTASPVTRRLVELGAIVMTGHMAAHVGGAEAVVYSSAVRPENVELAEARRRGLPIAARGELLAELMRWQHGIAVAGAHGKTTTTAMIARILMHAGLDPTVVIGARVGELGGGMRAGAGPHFVAEADESDRSFLLLRPTVAVMTNVDVEHLDHYGGFEDLQAAFARFASNTPFYGTVVACADAETLRPVLDRLDRRVVTYGFDPAADLRGTDVRTTGSSGACLVRHGGHALGTLHLPVPGRHNLQNALAAVAVGRELGLDFGVVAAALEQFRGAERRFQEHGVVAGIRVIDDYGHHPTEIQATIETARTLLAEAGTGRLIVAFQPHRYTRTKLLLDQFGPALAGADEIVLTDIYGAGEDPVPGVSIELLRDAIVGQSAQALHLVRDLADVPSRIAELARPGDVVVLLGAGSIGAIGARVLAALEARQGLEDA